MNVGCLYFQWYQVCKKELLTIYGTGLQSIEQICSLKIMEYYVQYLHDILKNICNKYMWC